MKAALYTRVSTEDQVREGTSLEVQREFLANFAKNEKYKVFKVYVDDGYSGYTHDRPALKELFQDARRKEFDVVLVYKTDRFARNNLLLLKLVEELVNLDIGFKSATEFFDTVTAAGKMSLNMLGTFAQFERDRIIERVFPGMVKGVEKGNWQGARYAPYGYSYNKKDAEKKLRVVQEEADIVNLIYTMYLAGQSTTQIAGYLYKKGYKTRSGGKFHSKLVCDILKNPVYIGLIAWNRHHYDTTKKTLKGYKYVKNDTSKVVMGKGRHEPIVAKEDFEAVQKKLDQNRKVIRMRKGSSEYPLTGIIVCGNCGHRFQGCLSIASRENRKTKAKRRYYRCCGRATHYVDCHEVSVRAETLEEEAYSIIDVIMSNPCLDEQRIESIVGLASSVRNEEIEREIEQEAEKLKEVLEQQKRLTDGYVKGYMAEKVYHDLMPPLRDSERECDEKIRRLKLKLIEKERSEEYQRLLKAVINHCEFIKSDLDIAGKKGLLRLLFRRLVIKDGRIAKFELYQPFQNLYEGARLKWQVQENQEDMAIPASVSTYARSDVK